MTAERSAVRLQQVSLPFRCIDAGAAPSEAIVREFRRGWPAYRRWFLHKGVGARPSYAECRKALSAHMPELVPDYEALVEAVGGGDLHARFLSHWCPPPLVSACSIAMLEGSQPLMVRNYDYPPALSDTLALRTHWSGVTVLGMSDCVFGLMDGMNDAGLAVAISFGGRRAVADGFGIGLVVRYLLQTTSTVREAAERLGRIPVQMSYNVAISERGGRSCIVRVAPDREAVVTHERACANRQGSTEWPAHADYSDTVRREGRLAELTGDSRIPTDQLIGAFLRPPLHRPLAESTWGTLYTAAYDSVTSTLTIAWPDDRWVMSVSSTDESHRPRMDVVLTPTVHDQWHFSEEVTPIEL